MKGKLLFYLAIFLLFSCQEQKEIKRDFVKFDLIESYQDSILNDTRGKTPVYMVRDSVTMAKELFAALKNAQTGDSATFELEADSVFKHGSPKFKKHIGGKVQMKVKVLGFLDSESAVKADMARSKKED